MQSVARSYPHLPRALALAALLALVPAAFAQQPATDAPKRIEDQMTAAEFRAAGLHQLSDEQLARLNAWLNREIDDQSQQAAQAAVQRVEQQEQDNRGLFAPREPVIAHIAGEFTGFREGRHYTLDNGQTWQQVDNASLPGVTLSNPAVEITPSLIGGAWYLQVEGYNRRAKVRRVE